MNFWISPRSLSRVCSTLCGTTRAHRARRDDHAYGRRKPAEDGPVPEGPRNTLADRCSETRNVAPVCLPDASKTVFGVSMCFYNIPPFASIFGQPDADKVLKICRMYLTYIISTGCMQGTCRMYSTYSTPGGRGYCRARGSCRARVTAAGGPAVISPIGQAHPGRGSPALGW